MICHFRDEMNFFRQFSFLIISLFFSYQTVSAKETIYLISSSSAYDEKYIPMITQAFEKNGFAVNTQYLDQQLSDFGYVNTDHERAMNLINALTDDQVKYLWFVRGGSGALNLLPELQNHVNILRKSNAKILIGFSDVTAIHYFINHNLAWKSVHGASAASSKIIDAVPQLQTLETQVISQDEANQDAVSENENQKNAIEEIFKTIQNGLQYSGLLPLNTSAKNSHLSGNLTGGNMTLVQTLFSTSFEKSWNNQVILLEDVNVTYKQLDRILHQISYKKDFKPKAIVFGQFYPAKTNDGERLIYKEVIRSYAERTNIPVFYYPYFGHGKVNKPFILGEKATISCKNGSDYCQIQQDKIEQ